MASLHTIGRPVLSSANINIGCTRSNIGRIDEVVSFLYLNAEQHHHKNVFALFNDFALVRTNFQQRVFNPLIREFDKFC
jgi:hypothetical protein